MCGFFVVLTRGAPVDRLRAEQATALLTHRGPDGSHHHGFERPLHTASGPATVHGFLGHTRLSILDPGTRSDQPMRRGAQSLVYNGEIYNFRALRGRLAQAGARFETEGDTELLLALLRHEGLGGLHAASGMWAFCRIDEAEGELLAARDRYGKKPLFWYADEARICLASEIAPIFHYLGRAPRIEGESLHRFLRHGWLYPRADSGTHVHGLRQVPAGASLRLDLRSWRLEKRSWLGDWTRPADSLQQPDPAELAATFEQAVRERLVADRRVGLLLSGGIDSSLILSVLCKLGLQEQVTCFTGDAGKSEDARYAQACIEALGIRAIRVPLDYGSTGMDDFLRICRHQAKPFPLIGNVLALPQMYAEIARHDVPVILDGTGGDEIFAGYRERYLPFAVSEARLHGDTAWIEGLLAAHADDAPTQAIVRAALDRFERDGMGDDDPAHPPAPGLVRLPQDPPDLDTFVSQEARSAAPVDPLASMPRAGLAAALVADATRGRLHEWLWQNDRNAMTHGIENRSPFLDHRLARWMHSGYRAKFVGPWNKHELRTLFDAFIPLPTQWRRDKQGFRWVYHRFLRSNRDAMLDLVAGSRVLRDCVDVGRLLDAARRDEAYLECGLLQRMFSVAGVEATLGMQRGDP